MGGIGFVAAIVILVIISINLDFHPEYAALLLLMLAFAAIGLADDLLKVKRRQNLGLSFWQKIILQSAAALVFALFVASAGGGLLYLFWAVFIVVGTANAANLTDGLNGLLAGTAGIAFLFFAILAAKLQAPEALSFSLISAGAILSFLYFNFPKARVFMGDAGALAIGAALGGLALIMHKEIPLALIGGVFVAEALSVIIQVFWYKLFKRRVFKMAPLHHHFELMGFKETTVVMGFWIAGIILGLIGVLF